MARRKIFGKKTFSKKHKSRRGRKITSNKTRRFRGGILGKVVAGTPQVQLASMAIDAATSSPDVKELMSKVSKNGTLTQ